MGLREVYSKKGSTAVGRNTKAAMYVSGSIRQIKKSAEKSWVHFVCKSGGQAIQDAEHDSNLDKNIKRNIEQGGKIDRFPQARWSAGGGLNFAAAIKNETNLDANFLN